MSRRQDNPAVGSGEDGRGTFATVVEAALWVWTLGALGYYYYSRDFHQLLLQAWERGLG